MSADTDKAWHALVNALQGAPLQERDQMRKVLIRRLKHYGVVDTPISPITEHSGRPKMPKVESPMCRCGDRRRYHDEDGSCQYCVCPQYASGE